MAYGLVEQDACHGGIYSAAEAEYDLVVTHLRAYFRYSGVYERGRGPVAAAAAYIQCEVGKDTAALAGVEDLRMELHRVGRLSVYAVGGVLDVGGRGDHMGAERKAGDGVTMRHPDLAAAADTFEQWRFRVGNLQHCTPVFPCY